MRLLNNTFEPQSQLLQNCFFSAIIKIRSSVNTVLLLISSLIPGYAQDCLHDTIPAVIICQKDYPYRASWCGNDQVYAGEFVLSAVDNCSKVKLSFDREGKIVWIELYMLWMDPNWPNGQITIYARDTSGNVSECIATYTAIPFPELRTLNFRLISCSNEVQDNDKIQLKVRTNDNEIHIANLVKNESSSLDFEVTLESNLSIQSLILEALDKPFLRDNITTFDQVVTLLQIVGIKSYSSPVNYISGDTDCDGEINILDALKSMQFLLGNISKDSCLGKPILYFIDDNGNILGQEIPYEANSNKYPIIAFNQIGDINRELPISNIPLSIPITKFGGEPLVWKTSQINCTKGNQYSVDFTINDSTFLYGLQCNFAIDSNLIQIDSFYTNFAYLQKHISPTDIRINWMNYFGPKFEHDYPKATVTFTAKSDITLSEAFKQSEQTISNFAILSNGKVRPLQMEFSVLNATDQSNENGPWMKISDLSQGQISIYGNTAPFQKAELIIYNIFGQAFYNQNIHAFNGQINESIQLQNLGVYVAVLKLSNRKQLVKSFVVIRS